MNLASNSILALVAAKPLTNAARLAAFDTHADALAAMSARLLGSHEAKRGMLAFLEKCTPSWVLA